jgi:hypothetical protein
MAEENSINEPDEKLKDVFITQLTTLLDMSKEYKLKIAELSTDTNSVMALQNELGNVAELIIETAQILQEISHASLTKSRELLKLVPTTHPRHSIMDSKLKGLGYGGRKTRKNKRKSRR